MITKALLTTAAVAGLALSIAPLAASAGEVQNRINRENARIDQGVHSGALTYGEYHRLDNGLDRIQAQRNRDLRRNDGHLTPAEAARLNREENHLSDRIWFDKHNRNRQH